MCRHAGGVGDARCAELVRLKTCGKAGARSGRGLDAFLGNRLSLASWGMVLCDLPRNPLQCTIQARLLGSHLQSGLSTSGVEPGILHF